MLSAGASSLTSHHAPCPLMPPLYLPLVCQLVVVLPLLFYCCLLSFSHHAASASQDALLPLAHFSPQLPLVCRLVIMLHLIAQHPPCISFCCAAASHVHPQPPAFICTGWLLHCISLRCLCLPSSSQHHCLLTRCRLTLHQQLHLLFASCLPQLVAALPLVAPPPHIHQLALPSAFASCCDSLLSTPASCCVVSRQPAAL